MQNWLIPSKESKGDSISRLSRPEAMTPGTTAMDAQRMHQNQASRKRPTVAAAAKNPKKKKRRRPRHPLMIGSRLLKAFMIGIKITPSIHRLMIRILKLQKPYAKRMDCPILGRSGR